MIMRLTDRFDDVLTFEGVDYRVLLSFDVVLRAYELADDPDFSELEKIEIWLEMFIENYEDTAGLSGSEKARIVETIFTKFINTDADKDAQPSERVFDLHHDAKYIYASFLYDYGIDLFELHGKLHWKKFLALLSSLSDESKFKRVVQIRRERIPPATKHNQEEIRRLRELKRIYRLPDDGEPDNLIRLNEEKMDALAAALRTRARARRG
jgi:hypothetical protein